MSDLDQLEDFIKAIARETQWNTGQALIGLQRLRQQMEQQEEVRELLGESIDVMREAIGLPRNAIVDEVCTEARRIRSQVEQQAQELAEIHKLVFNSAEESHAELIKELKAWDAHSDANIRHLDELAAERKKVERQEGERKA